MCSSSPQMCSDQDVEHPANPPRRYWEDKFRAMADCGDDMLLDDNGLVPTSWEDEEGDW